MKAMKRKALSLLLAVLLLFTSLSVGISVAPVVTAATATQGDVDGDGQITSTDARLVLQYYAGKIKEENLNLSVADVDGDSAITSTDARLILQYYAGKIPEFPGKAGHTVTFVDTDGTVIATQTVAENGTVTLPTEPAKEGYTFKGWSWSFVEGDLFDPASPITSDITLYALWAEYYSLQVTIEERSDGDRSLVISAEAPRPYDIVVRLIEEEIFFSPEYPQNKEYTDDYGSQGSKEWWGTSNTYTVRWGTNEEAFAGRVIEVAFVDDEGQVIGEPAVTLFYTTRGATFADTTVEDFDATDTVLNFDEDPQNNFGVLADDVTVIRAESVTTRLDNTTGAATYTVQSPDKALTVGEKVFVNAPDCETGILCKIEKITQEGNIYVVTPVAVTDENRAYMMGDFYKFLKVDMQNEVGVTTGGAQQSRVIGDEISGTASITLAPIADSSDNVEVEGSVTGTATMTLKYEYAPQIFGENYLECSVDLTLSLTGTLSAMLKVESSSNEGEPLVLKLGKLTFPISVTGFSVYGDLDFLVSWELKGGIEAEWNGEISVGMAYSSLSDQSTRYREVEIDGGVLECKGEAQIRFGPQPSVGIQFLNGVATASFEGFYGIEIAAEAKAGEGDHRCKMCVDGTISAVAEITGKLELKGGPLGTWTPVKGTLIRLENEITKFYASILADEDVVPRVGFGECPNRSDLLRFELHGTAEYPYPLATNVVNTDTNEIVAQFALPDMHTYTNEAGETVYITYLPLEPGNYRACVMYVKSYQVGGTYPFTDGTIKTTLVFAGEGFGGMRFTVSENVETDDTSEETADKYTVITETGDTGMVTVYPQPVTKITIPKNLALWAPGLIWGDRMRCYDMCIGYDDYLYVGKYYIWSMEEQNGEIILDVLGDPEKGEELWIPDTWVDFVYVKELFILGGDPANKAWTTLNVDYEIDGVWQ